MKQFLKEWLPLVALGLFLAGCAAWSGWRAYRQYQVEQVILDLNKK